MIWDSLLQGTHPSDQWLRGCRGVNSDFVFFFGSRSVILVWVCVDAAASAAASAASSCSLLLSWLWWLSPAFFAASTAAAGVASFHFLVFLFGGYYFLLIEIEKRAKNIHSRNIV